LNRPILLILESSLNARRKGLEVADSLYFVVREFDIEMVFKPGEKLKRLEAVDPELFVEIVARMEFGACNPKMSCGKIQDFVGCLLDRFHGCFILPEFVETVGQPLLAVR
jgi:hypothetical protein